MINSQKTLVAYLDILGYKEIIRNKSPEDFYNDIENVFRFVQQLIDKPVSVQTKSNVPTEGQVTNVFLKILKFELLSDNIIIYCDLADTKHINNKYYNATDQELTIVALFFEIVSLFVVYFIARTGYLLKGGVCKGKFYSNTFDSSLLDGKLIFSKALLRGYELEQLDIHPRIRILVDESLANLWKTTPNSLHNHKLIKGKLQKDEHGEMYIDYYETLRTYTEVTKNKFILKIIERINDMLVKKDVKMRAREKWHWFKEYHNEKIKSFAETENQDLNSLLIN